MKKYYFKVYNDLKKEGNSHLYWIDGEKVWDKEVSHECTNDGVHPNDLGFYLIAQYLEKPLKKLLRKYGK